MRQNTLHAQTARFVASLATCLPELDTEEMQRWIGHPMRLKAVLNEALVGRSPHIINLDADPFVPSGMKVEQHVTGGGQFEWHLSKITFSLFTNHENGLSDVVNTAVQIRKGFEGKPVLNANVLDYLVHHPNLIPDDWKGKAVFFWGTIYRGAAKNQCVRYLRWSGGRGWYWNPWWFNEELYGTHPAAMLAA